MSHQRVHERDRRRRGLLRLRLGLRRRMIRCRSRSVARRARYVSWTLRMETMCACCRARANTSSTRHAWTLGSWIYLARVQFVDTVRQPLFSLFAMLMRWFFVFVFVFCRLSGVGDDAYWWRAHRAACLANTPLLAVPALCTAPSPTQDGGSGSDGPTTSSGFRAQPRIDLSSSSHSYH